MYDHKGLDVEMLNGKDDLINALSLLDTSDIAPVSINAQQKRFSNKHFFFLFSFFFSFGRPIQLILLPL